ncbi:SDR family NAD(P)-dependent oxidoreductase [Solirubrobacter soli]|uniref:SDR family NAD(P)-dependent oxidoreductase n=1 Tax=Solirubrobacter soli TaxID=363832 RepID=UPI00056B2587|nr:SDR family oxidoreductase [Solirubrobacter soli]
MRVLVTGGASGIGAAIVERFARAGATGLILDLTDGAWPTKRVDVRDEDALREALTEEFDVVVAAAGVVPPWSSIDQLDLAEWDEVFAVNARGVAATLKHARVVDGGAIVVVASLNSWKGDPNLAAYVASKHAVLGIVRAAALDLGRRGIRVNAVGPGPIATQALLDRMRRREQAGGLSVEEALAAAAAGTALGRIATAREVADAVYFLAGATGITGHLLPVDGGIG